jgi:hypothetical protein
VLRKKSKVSFDYIDHFLYFTKCSVILNDLFPDHAAVSAKLVALNSSPTDWGNLELLCKKESS